MFLTDYKLDWFFPWMWFDCKNLIHSSRGWRWGWEELFANVSSPCESQDKAAAWRLLHSLSDVLGPIPSSSLSVWVGLYYCYQLKFQPSHHHLTFLWHDLNEFWRYSNIREHILPVGNMFIATITKHLNLSNFISWKLFSPHPTCQTKSFSLPSGTNRPQSIQSEKGWDWFNAFNLFFIIFVILPPQIFEVILHWNLYVGYTINDF